MLDTDSTTSENTNDTSEVSSAEPQAAPAPRRRAPRKATAAAGPPAGEAPSAEVAPDAPAPRKRAPRKATAKATTVAVEPAAGETLTGGDAPGRGDAPATDDAPAGGNASARGGASATGAAPGTDDAPAAGNASAGGNASATGDVAPAGEPVADAPARKTTRRTRKAVPVEADAAPAAPAAGSEADGSADGAADDPAGTAPAPARKSARKRAARKTAAPPPEPTALGDTTSHADTTSHTDTTSTRDTTTGTETTNGTDNTGAATDPTLVAPGVVFVAPVAEPPARRRRAAKKTAPAPSTADTPAEPDLDDEALLAGTDSLPTAVAAGDTEHTADTADAEKPEGSQDTETDDTETDDTETDDVDAADPDDVREAAIEQANGARRRRRRGRRGRGGANRAEDSDDAGDPAGDPAVDPVGDQADSEDPTASDAEDTESEDDDTDESAEQSGTSRRRRRRRRSGSGGDGGDGGTDDPPNTVVHVREKKAKASGGGDSPAGDDGVRGIKGSTRLEAKRQRRRDGRDTTRRRAPILTEAEFLARREAVDRVMAVRQAGDRTQIAVLEDDILVEHYVTRASATSYVGNVYLGRVQNVLPSMEAAFVDIGKGRNGVLYAGEVNWDAAGLDGKSRAIEHAMKSGDSVLVQVTKDPIGHKGARLTSQVSLPGRFVVYVPGGGMTGISRRLPDAERHRLKAILKKIVPDEAGVIVRTAAEGASEEDLTRDVERLQAQWESIQRKSEQKKSAPVLLHGEPDLAIRVVRDSFNEDFKSLVVQGADAWDTVSEYVDGIAPDLAERVSKHVGNSDLFHDLRIDEQLMKALDRKVWLPSGGSLVIDRTEAMTVIDVNTGKFVGSGGNLEQTVTRNNLEAAEEIVRQLRLRDVGGIVVIDFIDMVLESNRELVLRRLTECLGRDRTKHQVAEVTSLGLVQMTRKRVGEGLLEAFSEPCEHCHGRGVLVHQEPVEQKNGGSSDDEERSAGRGKRRRGGKSAGGAAEPAEAAEPPMTDEQRQAANAAIAAIHKAAALEKAENADTGTVASLATDLMAAARDAEAPAAQAPAASGIGEADTDVPSVDVPSADVPSADVPSADVPSVDVPSVDVPSVDVPSVDVPSVDVPSADVPSADIPAVELAAVAVSGGPTSPADEPGATNGVQPAGRRRRRAASRPAGPPAV